MVRAARAERGRRVYNSSLKVFVDLPTAPRDDEFYIHNRGVSGRPQQTLLPTFPGRGGRRCASWRISWPGSASAASSPPPRGRVADGLVSVTRTDVLVARPSFVVHPPSPPPTADRFRTSTGAGAPPSATTRGRVTPVTRAHAYIPTAECDDGSFGLTDLETFF